jgi:hypothetical protein
MPPFPIHTMAFEGVVSPSLAIHMHLRSSDVSSDNSANSKNIELSHLELLQTIDLTIPVPFHLGELSDLHSVSHILGYNPSCGGSA